MEYKTKTLPPFLEKYLLTVCNKQTKANLKIKGTYHQRNLTTLGMAQTNPNMFESNCSGWFGNVWAGKGVQSNNNSLHAPNI